jgi:hypothetical protein
MYALSVKHINHTWGKTGKRRNENDSRVEKEKKCEEYLSLRKAYRFSSPNIAFAEHLYFQET